MKAPEPLIRLVARTPASRRTNRCTSVRLIDIVRRIGKPVKHAAHGKRASLASFLFLSSAWPATRKSRRALVERRFAERSKLLWYDSRASFLQPERASGWKRLFRMTEATSRASPHRWRNRDATDRRSIHPARGACGELQHAPEANQKIVSNQTTVF